MSIISELLVLVIIGGLISVGGYDAVKSLIRYLLNKYEEGKLERGYELEEELETGNDNDLIVEEDVNDYDGEEKVKDDILDEIHDDVDEILDDTEDIVDDTTRGILKPVVGTVKLAGKIIKKAVKLLTFWRK